jgi:hypothetical protein
MAVVGFLVFVVVLGAVAWLYLSQIASSRRGMDSLHEGPDDTKRADDNQQPPYDGSSGWV